MFLSCFFFVIQTFKHLQVMSQVCVYVFIYMMSLPELCKTIYSAQASCRCSVQYIFLAT